MGNIVKLNTTIVLHGIATDLTSATGHQWVVDCCRAGEGLCSDQELMEKWELSPGDFEKISKNPALIRAIRAESERRIRSGEAARESAAKIWVRAPAVLGTILDDQHASPRHRIESAKELRTTVLGSGGERSPVDTSEKFIIRINIGGSSEIYEEVKPMKTPIPTIEDKGSDNE